MDTTPDLPQFEGSVLFADDCEILQTSIAGLITALGPTVIVTSNGQQAIEAVHQFEFKLIILDMHMPILSGDETVRELREQGISTPILALSADASPQSISHYLNSGCDKFLAKPFNQSQLADVFSSLLPNKTGPSDMEGQYYSLNEQTEAIREFIGMFSEDLDCLTIDLAEQELVRMSKRVHKLSGAAAFGYRAVYNHLIQLNESIRRKEIARSEILLKELKEIHFKQLRKPTS